MGARKKPQRPGKYGTKVHRRQARRWWNLNLPRREPWPDEERDSRKANMQMLRAIGVGLILSVTGGIGASWLTMQGKLTELELDVAVIKARLVAGPR